MRRARWMYAMMLVAGCLFGVGCGVRDEISELKRNAGRGDVNAQRHLADAYFSGIGTEQKPAEAIIWYRRAAEQGDQRSKLVLGLLYYSGEAVEQDYGEAVRWLRPVAEQGDAQAQRLLASCYYFGRGVRQDDAMAYAWCNTSINKENPTAMMLRSRILKRISQDDLEKAERLSLVYDRMAD